MLLAYSKIVLYQDLLASDLPGRSDPRRGLALYFPRLMREQFPAAIGRHRLRREIVATYVTNNMINRLRPTFVWQVSEETKTSSDVARAYAIIRDTFDLRRIWEDIEALDNKLAAGVQYDMMISVGTLLERAVRWLLRSEYAKLDIAAHVSEFRPRIQAIQQRLRQLLPVSVLGSVQTRQAKLVELGIPHELAERIAALDVMSSAMDIVSISRSEVAKAASGIEEVARVYFSVGARFGLDRLRAAGGAIAADTPQKAAVAAVVDDLFNYQSVPASRVIAEGTVRARRRTQSTRGWLSGSAPWNGSIRRSTTCAPRPRWTWRCSAWRHGN